MQTLPSELNALSDERWAELKNNAGLSEDSVPDDFKSALGLSDFIYDYCRRNPDYLQSSGLLDGEFELIKDYECALSQLLDTVDSEAALLSAIRVFRNDNMLRIAFCDLLNKQSIADSLAQVSALSQALITQTYQWYYRHFCDKYGTPEGEYGPMPMIVLGMGKLGGRELNFSSDIDLIFLYPEQGVLTGKRKEREFGWFFNRLAQSLINALDKVTADGRVFRVDMRLRPYGESGPLVMHFDAFENYLQEQGRDWERFAMVKARILNDASAYSNLVQSLLTPFVYRKYLDFSAIDALRKMKHLISQEVRRRQLSNNIKLGAGGIREIEFIVQSLQLISGGKQPVLRQRSLLKALDEIETLKLMTTEDCRRLQVSYLYLRKLEHCLQQFADQQTQTLPSDPIDQARLAHIMGEGSFGELLAVIQKHTRYVNSRFTDLIGEEERISSTADSELGSLWALTLDFDEASSILSSYLDNEQHQAFFSALTDFKQDAKARVHAGRGNEILDRLMPQLLEALFTHYTLSKDSSASIELSCTALFKRLSIVLNAVLRRTSYLELMQLNGGVRQQLIKLCHASLWIAEQIARFPLLLDELLNPQSLYHALERSGYAKELREVCLRIDDDDVEQQMEVLRQFKLGQQLRVAAADITGILPIMKVSDHLTYLAEAICHQVVESAWHQVSEKYGEPEGTNAQDRAFAIMAYGKFGGIELGYGSDLDLVFVYACDPNGKTQGPKPIENRTFYIKLAQRILHLFNTRTHSGQLYDVDMRLRPAGNSGLLVCHISTYEDYLRNEAWTWEHQALVRSRVVHATQSLASSLNAMRQAILSIKRDADALAEDVSKMREKMRTHLSSSDPEQFDIKQGSGGLVDIEFLVQYWVLLHAHQCPKVCEYSDNIRVLDALDEAQIIAPSDIDVLKEAYLAFRHEGHRLTLAGEKLFSTNSALEEWRKSVSTIWERELRSV